MVFLDATCCWAEGQGFKSQPPDWGFIVPPGARAQWGQEGDRQGDRQASASRDGCPHCSKSVDTTEAKAQMKVM